MSTSPMGNGLDSTLILRFIELRSKVIAANSASTGRLIASPAPRAAIDATTMCLGDPSHLATGLPTAAFRRGEVGPWNLPVHESTSSTPSSCGVRPFLATAFFRALPLDSDAAINRNSSAKAEFKRIHPCPATGQRDGPCSGYVIDHIMPLFAGGSDSPGSMQWQTVEQASSKDELERDQCRKR